jgi:leader peptidase (prepilin peptidase)/N-methyltransferase
MPLLPIDCIRIALIATLVYLAYKDWRTFRLPDLITMPLLGAGILFSGLASISFTDLQNSLLGALTGYCSLWFLNFCYRKLYQQNGIGMGDAKLLAALGAWFGWSALPGILFIASLSGLLGGVIWLRLQRQAMRTAFPFGPFLAIAGIIELLWPQLLYSLTLSSPA